MTTISLEFPDSILESYNQNLQAIIKEAKQVFIISEYQKGHLSLKQSADALGLTYRNFLELLWSKGIPIDALSDTELEEQYISLKNILEKVKPSKRQAGLGKGKFWMSDDFDAPLPDSFWLGDE